MDINAYIESGIIESYVLGLASSEESAELMTLAKQYPEVQNAITSFEISLEKYAFENAVTPPNVKQKVFDSIKDKLADERNTSVVNHETLTPVINLYYKRWQFLAAAALILLIVSAGLNFYFYHNYADVKNNYEALLIQKNSLQASNGIYQTKVIDLSSSLNMMSDTEMKVVQLKGVNNHHNQATVYWDKKTKDVYVLPSSLPQAPENKQYQLWAIVNGKPVDAGMIDNCTGLCKLKNIPAAQAFAVTLENKGGSPTPTMTAMFVMGGV